MEKEACHAGERVRLAFVRVLIASIMMAWLTTYRLRRTLTTYYLVDGHGD